MRPYLLFLSALTLPLAAACGGRASNDPAAPADGPVRGTVVDMLGDPIANAKLLVGDDVLTTDAAGAFAIPYAATSYDVTIATSSREVFVFDGLTSRTPTLHTTWTVPGDATWHGATLKLGGTLPAGRDAGMTILVDRGITHFLSTAPAGHADVYVQWRGPSQIQAREYAIEYEADPVTHEPTRYVGDVEEDVLLADGSTITWTPRFAERAIPQGTVPVTAPAGSTVDALDLGVRPRADFDDTVWLPAAPPGASVQALVPSDAASVTLTGTLDWTGGAAQFLVNAVAAGSPVRLVEPGGPVAKSPVDGATAIGAGAELAWDAFEGGTSVVTVTPYDGGDAPTYTFVTAGESVRIPDLARLGVALPAATHYRWRATETTTTGVDEYAASSEATPNRGASLVGFAEERSFTTP